MNAARGPAIALDALRPHEDDHCLWMTLSASPGYVGIGSLLCAQSGPVASGDNPKRRDDG
jgi:hypothetical protein